MHARAVRVPDSQQRGLLTQYCSHTADKHPIPHAHTQPLGIHWQFGTTNRPCCQSSAQRIIPAVLLAAVTVVKDMDELETSPSPLKIQAYSPPPSPPPDIPIVQHITPHLHTPREHARLTQHDYLDP